MLRMKTGCLTLTKREYFNPNHISLNKTKCVCCLYLTKSDAFVQSDIQEFIHAYIHTVMVVAAMQGADQQHEERWDTSTCGPGESNERPSDDKALPLPPSHSPLPHPENTERNRKWSVTSVILCSICDTNPSLLGESPVPSPLSHSSLLQKKSCCFHFIPRRHVGPGAALITALWDQRWRHRTVISTLRLKQL